MLLSCCWNYKAKHKHSWSYMGSLNSDGDSELINAHFHFSQTAVWVSKTTLCCLHFCRVRGFVSDIWIYATQDSPWRPVPQLIKKVGTSKYHNILHWKKPVMRWHCSNLSGAAHHVSKGKGRSDTTIHYGIMPCFEITTNPLWLKPSFIY